MNAKLLISILAAFLIIGKGYAQNQETTDSLARELQEVVVAAKQPATRLVGSTLVSTIPGTNLAGLGTALDVLLNYRWLRFRTTLSASSAKAILKSILTAGLCVTSRSYSRYFLPT